MQSTLVANEPVPAQTGDPRAAAALRAPLVGEYHAHHDLEAALGHRTRAQRPADGGRDRPRGRRAGRQRSPTSESEPDLARVTISTELAPGQTLTVVKLLAYGWSSERSMPALRDQVDAALAAAHRTGWDGLLAGQRAYLDDFWDRADIEIEGDAELQQAVRFALFQVVQAAARAEQRAIPAKGLTGRGYDGHTFWDMETYTLPVLTYTAPDAARDALRWRHSTLDLARGAGARAAAGGCGVPVADDSGRGVLRLLAGRHRGVPHQRRHRRRGPPLRRRHRRHRVRARSRASSCWSRRRGCGARSATTTRRAASASTASPAPTSTRRWSTTTSSPT